MTWHRTPGLLALAWLAGACGNPYSDRVPGERAPLTAQCDAIDPTRCLLPWPSSVFTQADPSTPTGLRLAVQREALPKTNDDPGVLDRGNGFSRVTPLVLGFDAPLAVTENSVGDALPLRLYLAQPDHARYGEAVPLRIETLDDEASSTTLLLAFPQALLEPNADYVAVVLDALTTASGGAIRATRATRVALGSVEPETNAEEQFVAYHAPTRALLDAVGVRRGDVVRVWDFTTRTRDDATGWLRRMRERSLAAVDDGSAAVTIDSVEWRNDGFIAAVVRGQLDGLPAYVDDGHLALDDDGQPFVLGVKSAPFRIVVPVGSGDYGVAVYGHGTGGSVADTAFDREITGAGLAKVGIEFEGWTGDDLVGTLLGLDRLLEGTHASTARLVESLAHGAAIEHALEGVLGNVLSAEELGGAPSAIALRRPRLDVPIWVGGSLAGTMGLTYASIDPRIDYAVVNVPGAAWTHWLLHSDLWATLQSFVQNTYGGPADIALAAMMTQGLWDPVDGAVFDRERDASPTMFLIQESIGDPILPNPGSEMVALSVGAVQVGVVLDPIVGVQPVTEAVGRSAITQFKTDDTDELDIHGFAGTSSPAGLAAREQIQSFFDSVIAGDPRITVPARCQQNTGGSCDFSAP